MQFNVVKLKLTFKTVGEDTMILEVLRYIGMKHAWDVLGGTLLIESRLVDHHSIIHYNNSCNLEWSHSFDCHSKLPKVVLDT